MNRLDIAIVGAACRLPQAADLAAFSDLLFAGRDAVTEIPADRWSKRFYYDPDPKQAGKAYTFAAGVLGDIAGFDPGFFGMSPREAVNTDPQQRLLLELAYEAMEDAGIPIDRLGGRDMGVFVGNSAWDYAAIKTGDIALMDSQTMQGMALSSSANRISYIYNLRGPSLTVDTACSSAMVALHLACQAIAAGETPAALVGGVNLLISPQGFVGFSRASMLSPTGRCHAFDARADGYVRSEGSGVLVLKTLADALADGDEIRAVIRATGVNSDGRTNGISVPSRAAQAALLRQVYERAEVEPDDLAYLEAHGTGTPVGDPIEAAAIGEALAQRRASPLPIGSVKTNIGHLEAASGMAGLLKVLAAFERGAVPPSLYGETPNPRIPFEDLNLALLSKAHPLVAGPQGVLAGINSFGFGGTNAHAVLAAPPAKPVQADSGRAPPLLLSARSEEALRALAADWSALLKTDPPAAAALVRGAARRREAHPHRLVAMGDALPAALDGWLDGESADVTAGQASDGAMAFVFSGNGSQWAGMGRDAYAHSAAFRRAVDDIDALLAPQLGWSVAARLAGPPESVALRRTEVAQPLLFAVQVGVVAALRDQGIVPDACIGHSVGEIAAAWTTGALSLEDACKVIVHRSRLQQERHGSGGMAVLGLAPEPARAFLAEHEPALEIAAVNGPASVTVAGPAAALQTLATTARAHGLVFSRLDIDYAFHSSAMDSLREPLARSLADLSPAAPILPLISTVTGEAVAGPDLGADYWWRNVREPVRFAAGVDALIAQGVRLFMEIGPQPTLQSYLRAGLKQAEASGAILSTLSADPKAADPFPAIAARAHVAGRSMAGAAQFDGPSTPRGLPAYPWRRQRFWVGSTSEAVELISPPEEHPLLGFRRDPKTFEWINHLSTSRMPWLDDHRVDGSVVLPAAAMVDMALAAARAWRPDATALELRDFEIFRPLLLDEARETVFRLDAETGRFELSSRTRLSHDAMTVSASGQVVAEPSPSSLFQPTAKAASKTLTPEQFYVFTDILRMEYGPVFRPVTGAVVFGPEAAEIAFDPTHAPPEEGCLVDPVLLDAAFQGVLATKSLEFTLPGDSVLPWRFGRVRLLRQGAVAVKARCELRRVGPKAHCADVALLDADGHVIAELLECWFVRVRPGEAEAPARQFWTALVPTPRQPGRIGGPEVEAALADLRPRDDASGSLLLARAYGAAAAHEALSALAQDGLVDESRIASDAEGLFDQLLGWLEEEGLAERADGGWRIAPESGLPASAEIWQSLLLDHPAASAEAALAGGGGAALVRALQTGLDALPLPAERLVEQLLSASPSAIAGAEALGQAVAALAASWPAGRPLRMAVIGQPSARLLRRLLARLPDIALNCVVATDDDTGLATLAAVARSHPGVRAQAWSPPADPVGASLGGEGFDLVVGAYAFTRSGVSAGAASALLAPGGVLFAVEPEPNRIWPLAFGPQAAARLAEAEAWAERLQLFGCVGVETAQLPGAVWPAALIAAQRPGIDRSLEPDAGPPEVESVILVLGEGPSVLAEALTAALAEHRKSALLPADALEEVLSAIGPPGWRDLVLVAPRGANDRAVLEQLPTICARLAASAGALPAAERTRFWLVAEGASTDPGAAALAGLRKVMTNEGVDCRFVRIEPDVAPDRLSDEVLAPGAEREVVLTPQGRLVPRLRAGLPAAAAPPAGRRLDILRPGLLGSLAWEALDPPAPGPGEVAIAVGAAGLNFRDVMWALGALPDEALMDGFSGPTLGLECAGVVTAVGEGVEGVAVGDAVAAVAPAALATHVVTKAHAVLRLPAGMDFAAAATLPVTAMTAVYALGRLADLQPGERVLIHGGLGGVGLAAIQYARHRGAVVFATAGSPAKRELLQLLGVDHVFDSRSASFADQILAATSGEGVDVVLNSLSGALMQESLRLLKPFGRFLEIGKRDLFGNTPVGLRPLRHNASYYAIDADQLPRLRPALAAALFREIGELIASGALKPLPYRAFGFDDAVEAFRLMQGSGHIGKIVLIPEPVVEPPPATPAFAVSPDRTYVVSGGTVGFGLETARWLAARGAKSLALLGRRGPATPGLAPVLADLAAQGVDARAFACDVAGAAALERTLASIRADMAPIGGVVHAAMVMDDGLLPNLDRARFAYSLEPKLAGACALDRLTRADPVEVFVLYSSIAAALGSPGQGNYVAANAAIEAIARRRHAAGLPALAVQWGPISDAGYLARQTHIRDILERVLASGELTAQLALDALPALIESGLPVAGYALVDWSVIRRQLPVGATPFLDDLADGGPAKADHRSLREEIAGCTWDEARALTADLLADEVSSILRLQRDKIDLDRPIADMGFDSLMALELRLAVEARLGQELPLLSVGGGTTLNAIAARVVRTARGEAPPEASDLADRFARHEPTAELGA
ncbi:MAG: hypothetical protein B7Y99_03275 [Caulobacterales bacterium 32-69-10]|nr:MAG: hypothetical protein B7Y99_03275 [Caulobacterales bacterium 32-69-10]